MIDEGAVREAARQLRAVLDAIEAGDLVADKDQAAYLSGALGALDQLNGESR